MNKVSAPTRFLIGISAGFIAISMPKLSGFLSSTQDGITFNLFTSQFLIALVAFSIIIGIAMVWLFMDSIETTKNLFMSALALPAVLSGGISISSVSEDAKTQISRLSQENTALENQLKEVFEIEIDDLGFGDNKTSSVVPMLLGISTAHAESTLLKKDYQWQANTNFKVKSLNRNYYLLFGKSTDAKKLASKKDTLTKQSGLTKLAVLPKGKKSYLIQNIPRTRTEALLKAITLKKKNIKVRLIRLK